ncbi:MAG: hypothetical protein IT580_08010 [Verrucomicrobiales bacterium]|nr:hypothetical protein [Verrucomicrobiales bacterium]
MSELAILQATLARAARRRRLDHALRGLWTGLLYGALTWLLALAAFKIAPLPERWIEPLWAIPLVAALIGFLAGGWRNVPLSSAARLLETRENLRQRLSTALEIGSRDATSEWATLVIRDASAAVSSLDTRRLLPLSLPRFAGWIPALLALVIGLGFVPEYRSPHHLKKQREAEVMRDTGRKVAALVRRELERTPPTDDSLRETLAEAGLLGEQLSQAKLTKAEGLQKLADATKRLEEESQQLESDPVLRKLQQAARSPSANSTSSNQALQRQLDKFQKENGQATPEALDKLQKDLQQAQKMAGGMQGNPDDPSARSALQQALQSLSTQSSELGLNLSGLDSALDALRDLKIDRLLKDLNDAGTDLEKLREMAQKLAEMKQGLENLGKNLAEQLDRGQAEAAAETLEKMVQQLASSGLTKEQMEKILKEVSQAIPPAGEYGKVSELLKQAQSQLASAKNQDGAQSLAKAASELRKLAQEAKEAQQLADLIESMKGAQYALMSDKNWSPSECQGGACRGCSKHGKPRAGKGGRPGRGVGTWADENSWMYFNERTERWDNTGLERPDQKARGHTDRGDGQLSANALPTKLRGQFNPGPMPSINLKGVSLKGESTVPYQQAVDAAQSDAQSALNQDKVPRAYRGAVKDYFDDLK